MKLIQSLLVFRGLTGQNMTTDDVLSWITSNITSDQSLFTADISGDGPIIVARAGAQELIRNNLVWRRQVVCLGSMSWLLGLPK